MLHLRRRVPATTGVCHALQSARRLPIGAPELETSEQRQLQPTTNPGAVARPPDRRLNPQSAKRTRRDEGDRIRNARKDSRPRPEAGRPCQSIKRIIRAVESILQNGEKDQLVVLLNSMNLGT